MDVLQKKYKSEIEELAAASRRLGELGFVTSQGGNLSMRVDSGVAIITPTKVPKLYVQFEDISVVSMDGEILYKPENRKPTGELPMHLNILKKRDDAKAVIHAHPPYLTGFSIANDKVLSRPLLPEPIIECGPVLNVEYAEPISDDLAAAFDSVIYKTNAFLMNNHGITIINHEGVARALELLEMLEAMAVSVTVARMAGEVREIPVHEVEKLERTIATRGLPMPGKPGYNKSLKELYY